MYHFMPFTVSDDELYQEGFVIENKAEHNSSIKLSMQARGTVVYG